MYYAPIRWYVVSLLFIYYYLTIKTIYNSYKYRNKMTEAKYIISGFFHAAVLDAFCLPSAGPKRMMRAGGNVLSFHWLIVPARGDRSSPALFESIPLSSSLSLLSFCLSSLSLSVHRAASPLA